VIDSYSSVSEARVPMDELVDPVIRNFWHLNRETEQHCDTMGYFSILIFSF
jgi:hypothetical protein